MCTRYYASRYDNTPHSIQNHQNKSAAFTGFLCSGFTRQRVLQLITPECQSEPKFIPKVLFWLRKAHTSK